MWSLKVIIILLLFCCGCLSTGHRTVYFDSRNFNNMLRWDAAKPAFPEEKLFYSVKYWSDDTKEPYQPKEECTNITALYCDLTTETPSLPHVHYRGWVRVNGRNHGHTHNFKPLKTTTFGPPILTTNSTVASLHVHVTLPLGPKGASMADIIMGSKNGPSKTIVVYTLNITHPKWAQQVHVNTTGQFIINLKNNQTEYCGYVVYKPSSEWGRPESENATFCATLSDPLQILPWLLVSAALLATIIITSVVCMCNYVKAGKVKIMPPQLVTSFSSSPCVMQSPDGNLIISKPEFYTPSDRTLYATILVKPNVPSVVAGGYSPQDIPCQDWPGSSSGSSAESGACSPSTDPEDTSAQSSEIYSVVAVHVPAKVHKDDQQSTSEEARKTCRLPSSSIGDSWDKCRKSPKLTSHEEPPSPCESDPAKPLLLNTVRDPKGQLILPSLTFQLQSSPGDQERRPLLSDLIDSKREGPSLASLQSFDGSDWSDSGCDDSTVETPTQPYCNSHYFPSQPVVPDFHPASENTPSSDALIESGYKQNWISPIFAGNASKDNCGYTRRTNYLRTWTAPKKVVECEEDTMGEERSRPIVLGEERIVSRDVLEGGVMVQPKPY